MADLDEITLAKLAREMVMNIRNYQAIFADFGISEEDYYEIAKSEYFKRVKEHFTLEWNSASSTADRIKLQGQAGTEVLMPIAIARALSTAEPLTSVIETLKMVSKIAGVGDNKPTPAGAAERFVITINLGADVEGKPVIEHFNKSIEVNPNDIDPGRGITDGQGQAGSGKNGQRSDQDRSEHRRTEGQESQRLASFRRNQSEDGAG
jgi:hypothetical protein